MIELNLLPDIKQEFVKSQRLKRIIISGMIILSMVSIGVVGVIASYVKIGQPVRQKLASDTIDQKAGELKNQKNLTRNLTIQSQLATLNELHDQKNDYSRWLTFLTILNPAEPNNMTLSNITIDGATNRISFETSVRDYKAIAVVSDTINSAMVSYTDLEGQKQTKKLFSEVMMTDASAGKDPSSGKQSGSAKFSLAYEPEVVLRKIKSPIVSVPIENTTPSASRVSIFAEKAPVATEGGAQ